MSFNLRNRSLLDLKDFPPRAIRFLLDLAAELKRSKYAGNELPAAESPSGQAGCGCAG